MTTGRNTAIITVDVAHPPMSSDAAEQRLDELLRAALLSGGARIIRVIHGYGSGGKGGALKTAVRNWAYRRRGKLGMIIPGEEYSSFDPDLWDHLVQTGLTISDLGSADPGWTLIIIS